MIQPQNPCPARSKLGRLTSDPEPIASRSFRVVRALVFAFTLVTGTQAVLAQTAPEERPPFTAEDIRLGYSTRSFLANSRAEVGPGALNAGDARAGTQVPAGRFACWRQTAANRFSPRSSDCAPPATTTTSKLTIS